MSVWYTGEFNIPVLATKTNMTGRPIIGLSSTVNTPHWNRWFCRPSVKSLQLFLIPLRRFFTQHCLFFDPDNDGVIWPVLCYSFKIREVTQSLMNSDRHTTRLVDARISRMDHRWRHHHHSYRVTISRIFTAVGPPLTFENSFSWFGSDNW